MVLTRKKCLAQVSAILIAAALAPPLLAQSPQSTDDLTQAFRLTAAERQQAVEIAERELTSRSLRAEGPIYVVDAELLRDKQSDKRRLALITHFRYQGNLAIRTLVDLGDRQVLRVESSEDPQVPLAEAELKTAIDLTLADARVQAALGEDRARVTVEGLRLLTSDPKDPLYGHRVLRMLFKVGEDYRNTPVAIVDLTTRRVSIEAPSQPSAEHH